MADNCRVINGGWARLIPIFPYMTLLVGAHQHATCLREQIMQMYGVCCLHSSFRHPRRDAPSAFLSVLHDRHAHLDSLSTTNTLRSCQECSARHTREREKCGKFKQASGRRPPAEPRPTTTKSYDRRVKKPIPERNTPCILPHKTLWSYIHTIMPCVYFAWCISSHARLLGCCIFAFFSVLSCSEHTYLLRITIIRQTKFNPFYKHPPRASKDR